MHFDQIFKKVKLVIYLFMILTFSLVCPQLALIDNGGPSFNVNKMVLATTLLMSSSDAGLPLLSRKISLTEKNPSVRNINNCAQNY